VERSVLWSFVQGAAAVHAGDTALVLRSYGRRRDDVAATVALARAAAAVAADVTASTTHGELTGTALDHARGMIEAATATLDRLANDGWRAVAGDPPVERGGRSRGADTVIERS